MKEKKLAAILDTAAEMFSRYGFSKTNIDDIARVAHVAKATIYSYVGNKDQLYVQVLRQEMKDVIAGISSSVGAESSPTNKVISFVKSKFVYMREAVNILGTYRDTEENLLPEARGIREELFNREVDMLYNILEEGKKLGVFFLNYPLITAGAMLHSIKGFELNWLVHQSEKELKNYIDEFISVFFYGVLDKHRPQRVDITEDV